MTGRNTPHPCRCGSTPIVHALAKGAWVVHCRRCGATLQPQRSKRRAVRGWNEWADVQVMVKKEKGGDE